MKSKILRNWVGLVLVGLIFAVEVPHTFASAAEEDVNAVPLASLLKDKKVAMKNIGTDQTIGHVATLTLTNLAQEKITVYIPPTVLSSISQEFQNYATYKSYTLSLGPDETAILPLKGICLDAFTPPVPSDVEDELKVEDPSSPEFEARWGKQLRLAIATEKVSKKLQKEGKFSTPYSKKKEKELDMVVQWATWKNIAELKGKTITKDDFRKKVYELSAKVEPLTDERKEKLDEGVDPAWDAIDTASKEAKLLEAKTEKVIPTGPTVFFKEGEEAPPPTPEELKKGALKELDGFLELYGKKGEALAELMKKQIPALLKEETDISAGEEKKLKEMKEMIRERGSGDAPDDYVEDVKKAAGLLEEALQNEKQAIEAKKAALKELNSLKKAVERDGKIPKIKKKIEDALKLEEKNEEEKAKKLEEGIQDDIMELSNYLRHASHLLKDASDFNEAAADKKDEAVLALQAGKAKAEKKVEDARSKREKEAKQMEGWIKGLTEDAFQLSTREVNALKGARDAIEGLKQPLETAENNIHQVF